MRKFNLLHVTNWRQFEEVVVDLSKQITVLTGQNGSGKTTILNLLSRHFGWNIPVVSSPFIGKKTAKRIWSDIYDDVILSDNEDVQTQRVSIGNISYDNGAECGLFVQTVTGAHYAPEYQNLQAVEGLHIPSHRGITSYNSITSIPTQPLTSAEQYQQYQQLLTQAYGGQRAENAGKIQKQSLISLALLGEGNSHVVANQDMKEVFRGFQRVLKAMLPEPLGFIRLEIRMPEVVLVTETGNFSLDAMSGGISAIFSIAWQIYMFGHGKKQFSITIDEPENHLHPTMQRTLLPRLAKAFPTCQFIIATHSPFIVSSFAEANVFALMQNERKKIISQPLDLADISGTPNEVLREILDVDSNLPVWVEAEIEKLVARSATKPPEERADFIMKRLRKLGISDAIIEYRRG